MTANSPVSEILTAQGVAHREFTHSGPIRSLEQAAAERGQEPAQVVRSLLFRVNAGDYVMVLMAGPQQVNWKALRRQLGENRLTMASREEVLAVSGYQLGAVAPFGLSQPVPLLVDESVFASDEISLGSGRRGTTIIMKTAVLREVLPAFALVNFSRP